jgi:hypothetical protein
MDEMTEEQWLQHTSPRRMLEFLRGRASPRKLRLFACACVRLVWDVVDESNRRVTEAIERDPDGRIARRNRVGRGARRARRLRPHNARTATAAAVDAISDPDPFIAAKDAADCVWLAAQYARAAASASPDEANAAFQAASHECRAAQAALLRDMFAPFRRAAVLPAWLGASADGTRLARVAYDERDFALLPVLADALEESGCDDDDVLLHLRGPGPHVRGCWVLDLLLEKG